MRNILKVIDEEIRESCLECNTVYLNSIKITLQLSVVHSGRLSKSIDVVWKNIHIKAISNRIAVRICLQKLPLQR